MFNERIDELVGIGLRVDDVSGRVFYCPIGRSVCFSSGGSAAASGFFNSAASGSQQGSVPKGVGDRVMPGYTSYADKSWAASMYGSQSGGHVIGSGQLAGWTVYGDPMTNPNTFAMSPKGGVLSAGETRALANSLSMPNVQQGATRFTDEMKQLPSTTLVISDDTKFSPVPHGLNPLTGQPMGKGVSLDKAGTVPVGASDSLAVSNVGKSMFGLDLGFGKPRSQQEAESGSVAPVGITSGWQIDPAKAFGADPKMARKYGLVLPKAPSGMDIGLVSAEEAGLPSSIPPSLPTVPAPITPSSTVPTWFKLDGEGVWNLSQKDSQARWDALSDEEQEAGMVINDASRLEAGLITKADFDSKWFQDDVASAVQVFTLSPNFVSFGSGYLNALGRAVTGKSGQFSTISQAQASGLVERQANSIKEWGRLLDAFGRMPIDRGRYGPGWNVGASITPQFQSAIANAYGVTGDIKSSDPIKVILAANQVKDLNTVEIDGKLYYKYEPSQTEELMHAYPGLNRTLAEVATGQNVGESFLAPAYAAFGDEIVGIVDIYNPETKEYVPTELTGSEMAVWITNQAYQQAVDVVSYQAGKLISIDKAQWLKNHINSLNTVEVNQFWHELTGGTGEVGVGKAEKTYPVATTSSGAPWATPYGGAFGWGTTTKWTEWMPGAKQLTIETGELPKDAADALRRAGMPQVASQFADLPPNWGVIPQGGKTLPTAGVVPPVSAVTSPAGVAAPPKDPDVSVPTDKPTTEQVAEVSPTVPLTQPYLGSPITKSGLLGEYDFDPRFRGRKYDVTVYPDGTYDWVVTVRGVEYKGEKKALGKFDTWGTSKFYDSSLASIAKDIWTKEMGNTLDYTGGVWPVSGSDEYNKVTNMPGRTVVIFGFTGCPGCSGLSQQIASDLKKSEQLAQQFPDTRFIYVDILKPENASVVSDSPKWMGSGAEGWPQVNLYENGQKVTFYTPRSGYAMDTGDMRQNLTEYLKTSPRTSGTPQSSLNFANAYAGPIPLGASEVKEGMTFFDPKWGTEIQKQIDAQKVNPLVSLWRGATPWKEEKGETFGGAVGDWYKGTQQFEQGVDTFWQEKVTSPANAFIGGLGPAWSEWAASNREKAGYPMERKPSLAVTQPSGLDKTKDTFFGGVRDWYAGIVAPSESTVAPNTIPDFKWGQIGNIMPWSSEKQTPWTEKEDETWWQGYSRWKEEGYQEAQKPPKPMSSATPAELAALNVRLRESNLPPFTVGTYEQKEALNLRYKTDIEPNIVDKSVFRQSEMDIWLDAKQNLPEGWVMKQPLNEFMADVDANLATKEGDKVYIGDDAVLNEYIAEGEALWAMPKMTFDLPIEGSMTIGEHALFSNLPIVGGPLDKVVFGQDLLSRRELMKLGFESEEIEASAAKKLGILASVPIASTVLLAGARSPLKTAGLAAVDIAMFALPMVGVAGKAGMIATGEATALSVAKSTTYTMTRGVISEVAGGVAENTILKTAGDVALKTIAEEAGLTITERAALKSVASTVQGIARRGVVTATERGGLESAANTLLKASENIALSNTKRVALKEAGESTLKVVADATQRMAVAKAGAAAPISAATRAKNIGLSVAEAPKAVLWDMPKAAVAGTPEEFASSFFKGLWEAGTAPIRPSTAAATWKGFGSVLSGRATMWIPWKQVAGGVAKETVSKTPSTRYRGKSLLEIQSDRLNLVNERASAERILKGSKNPDRIARLKEVISGFDEGIVEIDAELATRSIFETPMTTGPKVPVSQTMPTAEYPLATVPQTPTGITQVSSFSGAMNWIGEGLRLAPTAISDTRTGFRGAGATEIQYSNIFKGAGFVVKEVPERGVVFYGRTGDYVNDLASLWTKQDLVLPTTTYDPARAIELQQLASGGRWGAVPSAFTTPLSEGVVIPKVEIIHRGTDPMARNVGEQYGLSFDGMQEGARIGEPLVYQFTVQEGAPEAKGITFYVDALSEVPTRLNEKLAEFGIKSKAGEVVPKTTEASIAKLTNSETKRLDELKGMISQGRVLTQSETLEWYDLDNKQQGRTIPDIAGAAVKDAKRAMSVIRGPRV